MKKYCKIGEIQVEVVESFTPAGSYIEETGNFKVVEKSELLDYYSTVKTMYLVCSHGGSIERPLLVNEKDAKWLKGNGVLVYTQEEYDRECNK